MRRLILTLFMLMLLAGCGPAGDVTPTRTDAPATAQATRLPPTNTPDAPGPSEMDESAPDESATSTLPPEPTFIPAPLLPPPFEGAPLPDGARLRFGVGSITTAALSPDDSYLAIGTTAGLYMVRTDTRQRVWAKVVEGSVSQIAWLPYGETVAASFAGSGLVNAYEASTGTLIFSLEHTEDVGSIAWSPDGSKMAVGWGGSPPFVHTDHDINPRLTVWDVDSLARLYTSEVYNSSEYKPSLINVSWSPDSTRIAGVTSIANVANPGSDLIRVTVLWDAATGKQMHVREQLFVNFAAFSPDSKTIATWTGDNGSDAPRGSNTVDIWDTQTGDLVHAMEGVDRSNIYDVEWSADGSQIVTAAGGGIVTVWDVNSATAIQTIDDHFRMFVQYIALSPDGRKVAVGDSITRSENVSPVIVQDIATGSRLMTLNDHRSEILGIGWANDNQRLVTISDSLAAVHDTSTGERQFEMVGNAEYVSRFTLEWSADGQELTAWLNDILTRWNTVTGTPLQTEQKEPSGLGGTRWGNGGVSPDERLLAQVRATPVGSENSRQFTSTVTLLERASGITLAQFDGPPAETFMVVWSPDGSLLAVGGGLDPAFMGNPPVEGWQENTIFVWRTDTWEEIARLTGHTGRIYGLAFSPDSHLLASSSADGTVIIWDVGK